jgi:predicted amidohydrolase
MDRCDRSRAKGVTTVVLQGSSSTANVSKPPRQCSASRPSLARSAALRIVFAGIFLLTAALSRAQSADLVRAYQSFRERQSGQ